MKVVRININGSMNDITVDLKSKNYSKVLEKNSISQGTTDLKELYQWNYDNKNFICYGWYDGEAGFENKHDLIPNGNSSFLEENSDEKLLFGDIFILCKNKNKLVNVCVSDYAELYDSMFQGFDDCDSEEFSSSEEETPNSEDEDFIVHDEDEDEEEDGDYSEGSDEELDEDLNDY